jgi:redox-sensitive bicupin YhaK (pirin superfamily)
MTRSVRYRTRGNRLGPVMRLVSPQDLGEILKPFVFLDLADLPPGPSGAMRWHPHSGIATLTIVIDGQNEYRATTGVHGGLKPGGIEWMASGKGVWHTASAVGTRNLKGFQVWLLLPPGDDLKPPASTYLKAEDVPTTGGVHTILGSWNGTSSSIPAPPDVSLLDVTLAAGEQWTFTPPPSQEICWIATYAGTFDLEADTSSEGELLVLEDGHESVRFNSEAGASFIIGSARRSPFALHVGPNSVHTSAEALREGETEIARLASEMKGRGLL